MFFKKSKSNRQRTKQNAGIRSDRLSIRRQIPIYVYGLVILASALSGVGLMFWYQSLAGSQSYDVQLENYRVQLAEKKAEIDRLKSDLGTAPNELLMAQTAQQSLAEKLAASESEALKLKENLGICERGSKRVPGVRTVPIQVPGAGTIPANSGSNQ